MSATAFGGSFGLVKSDDTTLRDSLKEGTVRSVMTSAFPILQYNLSPYKGKAQIDAVNSKVLENRIG